jgi:hypothetical protein
MDWKPPLKNGVLIDVVFFSVRWPQVFTHVPCFVQIIWLSTIQALCNVFASSECKGVIIVWN